MKYALLILAGSMLMGCISFDKTPAYDYAFDSHISERKTYFIQSNSKVPVETRYAIESVIHKKLGLLGYTNVEVSPDIMVNYHIYKDDIKITRIKKLKWNQANKQPGQELQQRIKLKGGSLYISLYDKKSNQVVWRGYTKGHSFNPRIVKANTFQILDHFTLWANEESATAMANQENRVGL